MVQVFISYAAAHDSEVAARLAADLRAAGVDVWMAPDSIRPGESFSTAIDRGLQGSRYVLVLLSPASLTSRWVQTEVNAAIDRALRGQVEVVPLIVRPVTVPPLLSTFQQIDLTRYEQGLAVLGAALAVPLQARAGAAETGPSSPAVGRRGQRLPPDAFVADVLDDLDRGARRHDYIVNRPGPTPGSIVDSVVEVGMLRIGVAIWPPASATTGRVLAQVEGELRVNPHRVAGVLAVLSGNTTELVPYQLLDATSPNAVVLSWNEADGADAVGASIEVVVQLLTGDIAAD